MKDAVLKRGRGLVDASDTDDARTRAHARIYRAPNRPRPWATRPPHLRNFTVHQSYFY